MKFKDVLKEEFYNSVKYKSDYSSEKKIVELWKNPSTKEFYEIMKNKVFTRGVLLKNGNLFLTNNEDIIHDDILIILEREGILSFQKFWFDDVATLNNYLCVHIELNKKIFPAESYRSKALNEYSKKYFETYTVALSNKNKLFKMDLR